MNRRRAAHAFAALSVLLLLIPLSGCGDDDDDDGDAGGTATTTAEVADGGEDLKGDPVKLGLLTGLTGDYSAFADAVVNGSEIAISDINKGGGILDGPAELIIQDNKSTPEGAVSGFEKLVNVDDVVAIAGVESDGGVAVLDRAKEQQVPVICSYCGSPGLDKTAGEFMWRPTASDTDGGAAAAQFARDRGYERVGILRQEGGPGLPAEIFADIWENQVGGEITNDVQIDAGKSSYQVEVQQAFEGDPDAVYTAIGHEAGNSVFPEWQRRGYGGEFFVSPDLLTPQTSFEYLEDGVATGAVNAFDKETPAWKRFAEQLEAKQGEPPTEGLGEPLNFDSVIILALAIEAAGSTDGAEVDTAIPEIANPPGETCYLYEKCVQLLKDGDEIDYYGASSSVDFNDVGNLAAPLMAEIQLVDGEWTAVETIELDPELRP
jgi:branched-chain amino acid transport system substrate-binding protein